MTAHKIGTDDASFQIAIQVYYYFASTQVEVVGVLGTMVPQNKAKFLTLYWLCTIMYSPHDGSVCLFHHHTNWTTFSPSLIITISAYSVIIFITGNIMFPLFHRWREEIEHKKNFKINSSQMGKLTSTFYSLLKMKYDKLDDKNNIILFFTFFQVCFTFMFMHEKMKLSGKKEKGNGIFWVPNSQSRAIKKVGCF